MKRMPTNYNEVLACLNHLPRKMVSLQGTSNLHDFILYDICHEKCFNFPKAAYLIDNPDFDCFKGITGINKSEKDFCSNTADVWNHADTYKQYMQQSPFNNQVRQITRESIARHHQPYDQILNGVAHDLGFTKPEYFGWLMKHDNHGYLIVEHTHDLDPHLKECLENSVHLLSFCPIA